jgi:hypothetical protein
MKSELNNSGNRHINSVVLVENKDINEETRETLDVLFKAVINYYKMKNLISQVRNGIPDEFAQSRIAELNDEMKKVQQVLNEVNGSIVNPTINSELEISFLD